MFFGVRNAVIVITVLYLYIKIQWLDHPLVGFHPNVNEERCACQCAVVYACINE